MHKTILHVDINSYFATLLQQENPALRGRPVGVIKDVGRTCLIATSKEAKAKGVGTGSSKIEALALCPNMVLIPAIFDRYLDSTKRLQKIFKSFVPAVYIYSLDEAFLDASDCRQNLYPNVIDLGKKIQEAIKKDLGVWVTSNVGIAQNRFMAKLASNVAPKGSILEVTARNKDILLASTEFKDVCGVGYSLEKKLKMMGITMPYQIRFIPDQDLEMMFGSFWSKELMKIAYGEETQLLGQLDKPAQAMKSVGRSITGYRLYRDETEITNILQNLCIEIILKVRKMGLSGRQVQLALYGQKRGWSKHVTFKTPINHLKDLIDWVRKLFSQWQEPFPVIKFAVRLSLLKPNFQDEFLPAWQKQEAIQQAMDKINDKYGLFTLHPAAIPPKAELIRPEVTGFLGDRNYYLG